MRDVIDLRRLRAMSADEAATILAARLSDPSGPQDFDALEAWLALSSENEAAWDRVQTLLGAFHVDLGDADDEELAELRAAARAETGARPRYLVGWAAAATLAAVLAGGTYVISQRPGSPPPQVASRPSQTATFVAAGGEIRKVQLSDGSLITLDSGSALEVAFKDKRRDLTLVRGRAFFAVHHDASRPFVVRADGRDVVALGTKFDVRIDASRFQVVLVEGRVSVSAKSGNAPPIVMRAGQRLVEDNRSPAVLSSTDISVNEAWQRGMAMFRDEPLANVAEELNRYTADKLVVRDPEVAKLRVSGSFRTGDIARFGRTLAEIHPIRIVRIGKHEWEIVALKGGKKEKSKRR